MLPPNMLRPSWIANGWDEFRPCRSTGIVNPATRMVCDH